MASRYERNTLIPLNAADREGEKISIPLAEGENTIRFQFTWAVNLDTTPPLYTASGTIGPLRFSKRYQTAHEMRTGMDASFASVEPFLQEMSRIAGLRTPDQLKTERFGFHVEDDQGQIQCQFAFSWDGTNADLILDLNGTVLTIRRPSPKGIQHVLALFGPLREGMLGALDAERGLPNVE